MSRTVLILGGGSDIGRALAGRYIEQESRVVLTCREPLEVAGATTLYPCDVTSPVDIARIAHAAYSIQWDTLISVVGTTEPIGRFTSLNFEAWQKSITANALGQLQAFHALWPHRKPNATVNVCFFAGGGTNNPFTNYSAYALSKIALIKMAELLDDEEPELNCFVVGPGYVKTKIHEQTLAAGERAGANLDKTRKFLDGGPGTSMENIFGCIEWCVKQGKYRVGGRNISVMYDGWGNERFGEALENDTHLCKLRRRT